MPQRFRVVILIVVAIGIVGVLWFIEQSRSGDFVRQPTQEVALNEKTDDEIIADKQSKYSQAREIVNPSGFLNTDDEPITIKGLIGKKVILVDFWTYSCINCQRTMPYLTSWYDKYRDQGLEIIGVHTPEFEFEKKRENVQAALNEFGIEYPVVMDNDYGTWSNYGNRYWPRKYIIDIDGFIVYDHIGEGAYAETEEVIQGLLSERMTRLGETGSVSSGVVSVDAESVNRNGRQYSPETYFGAWRNSNFGNGTPEKELSSNFVVPDDLRQNQFYLDGAWDITDEYITNTEAGARIIFPYQAAKVFMVAGAEQPVRLQILRDGEVVGRVAGQSVDADGYVTVEPEQLYRLIEDSDGWGEHTLEIIVEDPGLQAFTFTFG